MSGQSSVRQDQRRRSSGLVPEGDKASGKAPSANIEEYLEAIFRLLQWSTREYVKTGELAAVLEVTPPSVTQMIQKLAERGYVEYRKGRGARLTRRGWRVAVDVLRRHRVAERLLVDLLGVSWEEAHKVACRWEHLLTPEMCDRILARLEEPATCPHGNPIPSSDGTIPSVETRPLTELEPGEEAIIECISDERPELLRRMASMGMLPGETVKVVQTTLLGDTMMVEVGSAQYAVSRSLAEKVRVSTDGGETGKGRGEKEMEAGEAT